MAGADDAGPETGRGGSPGHAGRPVVGVAAGLAQCGEPVPQRLMDVNQLFAERSRAVAGHR